MIANTHDEREGIRESGRRLAEILDVLKDYVEPGVDTQYLEDRARELCAVHGAVPAFLNYTPHGARRPYPAALCVSVNDEIVHGIPNEVVKTLREADVVTLDMGINWNGYYTDHAVTVPVGRASDDVYRLIECTQEALQAGIDAAVVGNTLGDVGAAIEAVGRKYKLKYPKDLGGHGVGQSVHEEPYVHNYGKKGHGEKLVDGLVIAIEPMFVLGSAQMKLLKDGYTYVTIDGSKAAHCEHTVMVLTEGTEVVTSI